MNSNCNWTISLFVIELFHVIDWILFHLCRDIAKTTSVTSLLANPNITVTPREKSTANPVIVAANTGDISVTSRPMRPQTVDLTVDMPTSSSSHPHALPHALPHVHSPTAHRRESLICQVCDKTFSSVSMLKAHLHLHLKRAMPVYNRHPTQSLSPAALAGPTGATGPALVSSTLLESVSPSSECSKAATSSTRSVPAATPIRRGPPPVPCDPLSSAASAEPTQAPVQVRLSPTSITNNQKNGSSKDMYIPIVDVSRAGVLSQLVSSNFKCIHWNWN